MAGSKPGERRGGRQKGTPNKTTRQIKEMVVEALERAGGVEYLARQAKRTPAAFLTLVGKVLPIQVKGEIKLTEGFAERLVKARERARGAAPGS